MNASMTLMPLKKSYLKTEVRDPMYYSITDYKNILQGYEDRLNEDLRIQRMHRREVYRIIPSFKSLDDRIADISTEAAMRSVEGDDSSRSNAFSQIDLLSRQKLSLLKAAGFPDDYLEIHYSCPDCRDTGFIGTDKCHCLKQRLFNALYRNYPVFSKLEEENFDTFSYSFFSGKALESMHVIHDAAVEFTDRFAKNYTNMLFYGNVGCGKTFLTNCIAKALLDKGFSVVYLSAFQLFDILNAHTFRGREYNDDEVSAYSNLFECDLLIIDDLGTEILSSAVSAELFQILNSRDTMHRPTIISSNLSLQKLRDNYSERSMSRILGNYKLYKFEGNDIRLMKRRKS